MMETNSRKPTNNPILVGTVFSVHSTHWLPSRIQPRSQTAQRIPILPDSHALLLLSVVFVGFPSLGNPRQSVSNTHCANEFGTSAHGTIHQPSINIFQMFEQLLLMKRGGEVVFFGPLGKNCQHLVDYFEAIPSCAKLPDQHVIIPSPPRHSWEHRFHTHTLPLHRYNPATWMLDLIGAGVSTGGGGDAGAPFVQRYNESDLGVTNTETVAQQVNVDDPANYEDDTHSTPPPRVLQVLRPVRRRDSS